MLTPNLSTKVMPDPKWSHYEVWKKVNSLFYSLPNYFRTDLIIKGIHVTEIFSVGNALALDNLF